MSNFSWSGGQPRCFTYWQEYSKCYTSAIIPQQCKLEADDYMECLHGKKEAARNHDIAVQARKLSQETMEERAQDEGLTIGVGLIQRPEEPAKNIESTK